MRELTPAIIAEAERMRNAGKSYYEIGRAFGVEYRKIMRAVDPQYAERERLRKQALHAEEKATLLAKRNAVGLREDPRVDPGLVESRRGWQRYPDTRDFTARFMGDPHPARQFFMDDHAA